MEQGPLPPHERPWRHPSELGPPSHEPTTTGGRVLIASAATLGLLLVGVLALSMTPRRGTTPTAAGSSLSSLRVAPASLSSVGERALPLVTPVGDDGWGVTTSEALAGAGGRFVQARLPTGDVVEVEIVGTDASGDLTVVALPPDADAETFELAAAPPTPTDTVLVRSDDPVVVTMEELTHLEVDEATPVLDDRGRLIGLCTGGRDERWVMRVDEVPIGPTSTTPTTTTTRPTPSPVTMSPTSGPTTAQPTTPTTVVPTTAAPPATTTKPTVPRPTTTIVASTDAPGMTTTSTVSPDAGATDGSD